MWQGETLYASIGYSLVKRNPESADSPWTVVAQFNPAWWRRISSANRFTYRLCRDGFHSLAVLTSGHLVAAVPGAIAVLSPGGDEFRISHRISRGIRPLNIAVTDDDWILWGEYFDNSGRDEVYIYGSKDYGETWDVVHAFPKGKIRHIHNIVYDRWEKCLWILTGDYGEECKIIQASCDLKEMDVILCGNQQGRAVAIIPTQEALFFASDTPLETNYVYRLDRSRKVSRLAALSGSSLYGCQVDDALFFSTVVEPSMVNENRDVRLYGSLDGISWHTLLNWTKDRWPKKFFQYGNIILPAGNNTTGLLALTSIAVEGHDLCTTLWEVSPSLSSTERNFQ